MEKNCDIAIRNMSNGFMASQEVPHGGCLIQSDTKVFQSMSELLDFISVHFDYRSGNIRSDLEKLDSGFMGDEK